MDVTKKTHDVDPLFSCDVFVIILETQSAPEAPVILTRNDDVYGPIGLFPNWNSETVDFRDAMNATLVSGF